MNVEVVVLTLLTIISASTPLVYAAIGELITEKAGVLNLGVEGMMLAGAICSFAVVHLTGNEFLGIATGMFAGMAMSLVFGFLCLTLQASQVATGLALTIFGIGLSSLLGQSMVGVPYAGLSKLTIPVLSDVPVLGPLLFNHDVLVYGSFILVLAVAWFLYRSSAGLRLRAVGDAPDSAHTLGLGVLRIRYLATLFGGACSGLGGAYLSLSYSPMWGENMTAGRGWIALALVVFATWRPGRLLFGAYFFGTISIMQLHGQAWGLAVPSQIMSMLPYLATIVVLVLISQDRGKIQQNAPASLGRPFYPSA